MIKKKGDIYAKLDSFGNWFGLDRNWLLDKYLFEQIKSHQIAWNYYVSSWSPNFILCCVNTMSSKFGLTKTFYDLPSVIIPSVKYIFFLHGKTAENYGPNGIHPCFGIYDYHGIVNSFANCGFTVISEIRLQGTKLDKYAGKIARQVTTLLANGIPPEQITVAGFSKGATIALLVSSKLKNPGINFVVMGLCGHNGARFRKHHNKLMDQSVQFMEGRFLSIYDFSDLKCADCQRTLKNVSAKVTFKEIILKNGLGHSLFYRPRRDWVEPVAEWINQKH
jgi:predicted esterase